MKRTTRTRAGAKRSAAARRPSAGSGMGGKLLIMAALVAAVVFGVAIFFKVGRIEVQGNTIYASDKIIEASGLELGDNLLTVSRATVGGNVKAALPYVDQVSVGRVLPDTVVISVKESQLAFAAATDTNTVWLISPSGKALERIDASLQEQYPQITLECAIPYERQAVRWPAALRERYFSIASKCDKETMLQRQYTRDCMKKRNQYMVNCAEIVLAVWNGEPSGTGQTVWYAKEKGKIVWRIDPATLVMEF